MTAESVKGIYPAGMQLRHTLWRHEDQVNRVAWSPDGLMLASSSLDNTIRLWDPDTGAPIRVLRGHAEPVISLAFSPAGRWLASGSKDNTIRIWDSETGRPRKILRQHADWVQSLAWSPSGKSLASASSDGTVLLWNAENGELRETLPGRFMPLSLAWSARGGVLAAGYWDGSLRYWDAGKGRLIRVLDAHSEAVYGVAWTPDGSALLSCSDDHTIGVWDGGSGRQIGVLEGHTDVVNAISFSADGTLFATKSADDTVRLWRYDTWETVAILEETTAGYGTFGLAFHPTLPVLATLGEEDTVIRLWDLAPDVLLSDESPCRTVHYTNAKIVLVGDTGVGKSGLGLVLTDQKFRPTDSTHGRHVWQFESEVVETGSGRVETREALLWDLAGQPSYRLIHQLHLNEVTVALVLFDARSETDPLAGVHHWNRALRQAQRVQGDNAPPMKKLLVAARVDRGGIGISHTRMETLVRDMGFDGFFETSAREGWGVDVLRESIRTAIDWNAMPKVSSTELFQRIKMFLLTEKESGNLLSTANQLYRVFQTSSFVPGETGDLWPQFETCIGLVESRGLIRRLSFGDLVLLQPELLDAYASAIVNAAKDEPDGLGCILEDDARAGRFRMSEDSRIPNREQERLLLAATVEDLLRHEIALREQADTGPLLVFPSQFTREHPDLPNPDGKAVIFTFEGPVLNIYATLAVRLSHSGVFRRKEMWKSAATYHARVGGICGMFLREMQEGRGELTLFYDGDTSEETRFQFEEYVYTHLVRRALPDRIERRRLFICSECGTNFTDQQVAKRRERGYDFIECNVCEKRVSLLDREERLAAVLSASVIEMDRAADEYRELETGLVSAAAVMHTQQFRLWVGSDKSTLALAFTDIVSSTALGNEIGHEAMRDLTRAHFAAAREQIERFHGFEIKSIGDGLMVAFRTAADALQFALGLSRKTGHPRVQIRAGIHIGPVTVEENDAFGATVNFAARVVDFAKHIPIKLSSEARQHIVQTQPEVLETFVWTPHPDCELKGFPGLHTLWEVSA